MILPVYYTKYNVLLNLFIILDSRLYKFLTKILLIHSNEEKNHILTILFNLINQKFHI